MTATRTIVDDARVEAFAEKVLGDFAGASACYLGALGDALGLFTDLDGRGPATSVELAGRAGLDERYVREWLAGMNAAGYLTFDASTGRYALPAEHAPVLAQEGGPMFFGAALRDSIEKAETFAELLEVFRRGGGIAADSFTEQNRETLARFTAPWFENALRQEWLPRLPEIAAVLEAGASVADVGCGRGLAAIRLAQAYPRSRFAGYDVHAGDVAVAQRAALEAGVADRVRFEVHDVTAGLPETFDVITAFDVIHDAVDPAGILRAIHAALAPGGRFVCVDVRCGERPEDNVGPIATIMYASSVSFCLTVSLAEGGAGLGTCGLAEPVLRRMAAGAGFRDVRHVQVDDPFNTVYELTP
ncbi:class I SAM-dependent methyltransferase [Blastococcus tunisiensis]|uniref:Methyltransferase domain-containing protein n=1 Tax=Blastococcus tunisiensis TaxID=1798228 RepID=A0A1I1W8M5_9ACTN|nr:class I SAM-dependent methyltransferase [Blastococcus sp. DSM 46838]SFD91555.1 Methyltransferase domain-containing protein [Blastococcus sp. DSM 46838]